MEYFRATGIMTMSNLGKAIVKVRNTYFFLAFIFSYSPKVIVVLYLNLVESSGITVI